MSIFTIILTGKVELSKCGFTSFFFFYFLTARTCYITCDGKNKTVIFQMSCFKLFLSLSVAYKCLISRKITVPPCHPKWKPRAVPQIVFVEITETFHETCSIPPFFFDDIGNNYFIDASDHRVLQFNLYWLVANLRERQTKCQSPKGILKQW